VGFRTDNGTIGLMPDPYGIPDQFFGPVPGQFYAVVGRVTMLGALLEQRLLELLWSVDEEPQELHAGKHVAQLLTLIERRLDSTPDGIGAEARDLLARAKSTLEDRNAIVHSLWPEPSLRIAFRWRPRTLKRRDAPAEWMQGEFVTKSDLRRVINDLVALNDEVGVLSQRFHASRKPR
jgi:hypothetical protein